MRPLLTFFLISPLLYAQLKKLKDLEGCYYVDYSYSEIKALAEGYSLDPRFYDVTKFTIKELIKVTAANDTSVRLQHFMQAVSPKGETAFMMRHHGETWEHNPGHYFRYEGRFGQSDHWQLEATNSNWIRKIWNLDDGLRYQCVGDWRENRAFPTFKCSAFSPIPGRETRDMGRKDYNTLERKTTVQLLPNAFLERQNNQKILFDYGRKKP